MNALIVAAGLATRLRPLTDTLPKGLLSINGRSLLDRSVALLRAAGVEQVVVVVGHGHEQIQTHLGHQARYVRNPFYSQTNNMASLWLGLRSLPEGPLVYLHSDILYPPALLDRLLNAGSGSDAVLLVDTGPTDNEAMKVRVEEGRFVESSKSIGAHEAAGEWTGIARFSPVGIRGLRRAIGDLLGEGEFQAYDTAAFNRMAAGGFGFDMVTCSGIPWIEIDTPADLKRAKALFASGPTV